MTKLKENTQAADFTIEDLNGNEFTLSDFKEKKNLYIVLNRGFVWPFARKHMMQLHQDKNKFQERDTVIVVIGPEDREDFKEYWEENELDYYGIPDPEHKVLELYGQEVKILKMGRMPAQILVDKEGIVRYTNYGKSMKDITDNEEILKIIDEL